MHLTLVLIVTLALAGCAGPSNLQPRAQRALQPSASSPSTKPATLEPDAGRQLATTPERFLASCARDIQQARSRVEWLVAQRAPRDTVSSLTAYDDAIALLDDAVSRSGIASNSHPDAAFREAGRTCEQEVEAARTDISLDQRLYVALAALKLDEQDAATRRWVARVLRDFRREGVDRDAATRQKLRELHEQLTWLGQEFGRHIQEDVRRVDVGPEALEGLPEDYVRAHPPGPDGRVHITTETPDYLPFMAYSRSGPAREALWRINRQRGYPANLETLSRLLQARYSLATLLGYPNWAAYASEDKMVRGPQAAADFIERLSDAAAARAKDDYAALLERKRKDAPGATEVEPWEQAFLEDRVRAEQYHYESREVRGYFEYTRVKQGLFDITSRLFGLTYRRAKDAPVWHPDVEAWDVYEGDTRLGRFYLDMHPRPDKLTHSSQWDLATGRAGRALPEAVLMCNFPRPGTHPALLQHSEVRTFFHEFGHLLHHILGGHARWAGLSGSRTERDFVEAPAQVLEEWAWRPESLQLFARHFVTGEPLPAETIARMRRADAFGKGLWLRQQLFYAAVSLQLHTADPAGLDTTTRVNALQERYMPFRAASDSYVHLSFTQLDGYYSSAYYAYLWSLVIARDLLTPFQQHGLMDPATARRYRDTVLGPGGSKDAADLVRDFLGRDYGFGAYTRWLDGA
ncbi:Zn-dependent oligopeptidase [Pyxidicoccus parkwayensis]|uniref:Zn-dependent oligopeptidase n=1 Tax=Pyxidicoccus parkwayensis TaxID=2813578 RepID=A0ABX7NLW4_9BACT|nr:M3 family metallopeptidase [Pyxidicoccus parkwaysis]QSQ19842.1 Zn-dependent oligopeptidase [Pyxidicoccus parkwaysis]